MLRTTFTAVLTILSLTACGADPEATAGSGDGADTAMTATDRSGAEDAGLADTDVRAILALDRAYQDAVQGGDWDALRQVYASDAVHMPPDDDVVEGLDAIIRYYEETGSADGAFATDTDVIHGDDTIGYHRGSWSAGTGDAATSGHYLWVLRRMPDGEWRIVAGMATLDG